MSFNLDYNVLLIATLLIGGSIFKHLTLQSTGIKNNVGAIGANVFIGVGMCFLSLALFAIPASRHEIIADMVMLSTYEGLTAFVVAGFKGLLVMAILFSKQSLAKGMQLNAYALAAFVGIGPLAIANNFTGELLTQTQMYCAIGLTVFGAAFLFIENSMNNKERFMFVLLALIGVSPAATDNYVLQHGMSWQTSIVISNFVLLVAALVILRKKEGAEKVRDVLKLTFSFKGGVFVTMVAWVISEIIILWAMFDEIGVTATEMTRNLYIPLLMVISAYVFKRNILSKEALRKEVLKAAGYGSVAYAIAFPLAFA